MISKSLIILAVVGFCCAATWQGYLPTKPKELAHKEGCYVKEINDVVPFGTEVKPIGSCVRIDCDSRLMYYASCPTIHTEDPTCFVTDESTTSTYPDCCPTIACESENRI